MQDLVGWDFDIIDALAGAFGGGIRCVGDFRQTIYRTSCAVKKPQSLEDKLSRFKAASFSIEYKNTSYRCNQAICDLADQVHISTAAFPHTESSAGPVPAAYQSHVGTFTVSEADLDAYIAQYGPVILRWKKTTKAELCKGRTAYNFGEAKGLGFERVLILPTEKYEKFLAGDLSVFDKDKSDEARNKLYVAITRARYSVAFAYAGEVGLPGITSWKPGT